MTKSINIMKFTIPQFLERLFKQDSTLDLSNIRVHLGCITTIITMQFYSISRDFTVPIIKTCAQVFSAKFRSNALEKENTTTSFCYLMLNFGSKWTTENLNPGPDYPVPQRP